MTKGYESTGRKKHPLSVSAFAEKKKRIGNGYTCTKGCVTADNLHLFSLSQRETEGSPIAR